MFLARPSDVSTAQRDVSREATDREESNHTVWIEILSTELIKVDELLVASPVWSKPNRGH